MTRNKSTIGILGAGISGLSIAYKLSKLGHEVSVYEKEEEVGGVIQSRQGEGWLTELGPNTLMVRSPKIWDLLEELELKDEIIEASNQATKRYILKDEQLMPLPSSLGTFIKSDLLSGKAKLRLLKEPFISRGEGENETIADFITRRLGKEVLDYGVNPFVAGIFAGDPDNLSVKHTFSKLFELERKHGSLVRGMMKQDKKKSTRKALISFKQGLQTLPLAIRKRIGSSVYTQQKITELKFCKGTWQLHFKDGSHTEHDALVSSIPIPAFQKIIANKELSSICSGMEKIFYAPVSVVHLGFREEQIAHALDGFGMLIPENEQGKLLGTLFSSSLFPGRAPEGHALLTSFIGGAREPERAHIPGDKLIEITRQELNRLLGIEGNPVFVSHTYWKRAIPQYEIGYDQHLENIDEIEERFPGLYLAGSYRGGVSVPDCITNGMQKAREVARNLGR